jgi:PAS domain S-box-containing protein
MGKPLRVLMVEDSEDDVLLMIRALKQGGYDPVYERVEDAPSMRKAIEKRSWDIILCDYQMPQFDGLAAIALLKETGIDIPLIIVSGVIGEERAVACMRQGAQDYVMKGNLSRLVPAIERELKEAESRIQRKRAEEALRKSETNYRQLFDNSPVGIYQVSFRTGKFLKANDLICEYLGCSQEEITSLSPYDSITKESKKLLTERLNKMVMGEKVPEDPEYEIVDKKGKRKWLKLNAKNIYDSEGLAGADVVAHDITELKRTEEELRQTLESLGKAISTTIQVMVSAVESRDPYTSGHQLRSADIARAIASEMGLPPEKIDGIRMAGSIHDIGKLSIPAEILSKPTKLTNIEFSLIKEHSQKGYEMLKDVESAWPLAEIVYQHHERMDGSGYPRNLKGKDILMEARILAVSDVVEAMASHRPYRPAIGIKRLWQRLRTIKGRFMTQTPWLPV